MSDENIFKSLAERAYRISNAPPSPWSQQGERDKICIDALTKTFTDFFAEREAKVHRDLLEVGFCGKHPMLFNEMPKQSLDRKPSASCTLCDEQIEREAKLIADTRTLMECGHPRACWFEPTTTPTGTWSVAEAHIQSAIPHCTACAQAEERDRRVRHSALDEAAEALSRVQHVAGNVQVILALKKQPELGHCPRHGKEFWVGGRARIIRNSLGYREAHCTACAQEKAVKEKKCDDFGRTAEKSTTA